MKRVLGVRVAGMVMLTVSLMFTMNAPAVETTHPTQEQQADADAVNSAVQANVNEGTTNTADAVKNIVFGAIQTGFGRRFDTEATGLLDSNVPIAGGRRVTGQAAGDGFNYPWGIWGSYTHSRFDDDFTGTAFDSDADTWLFGADFAITENVILGASIGYDTTDVSTLFNAGQQAVDTFTVAPYMGVYLSDYLDVESDVSMNVAIGYSMVDIDSSAPGAGAARVTSSTDSDRFFYTVNVNAGRQIGDFYGSLTSGIVYSRSDTDGFVDSTGVTFAETDSKFGRFTIGGDVSYLIGGFEPFASAAYRYDFSSEDIVLPAGSVQPDNDKDDFDVGLGVRYYGDGALSGSVTYTRTFGRSNVDQDSINLLLRADF